MDAVGYAAWVLKPTSDPASPPSGPDEAAPDAKVVREGRLLSGAREDEVMDQSPPSAEGDGADDGAVLLFIDNDDDDDDDDEEADADENTVGDGGDKKGAEEGKAKELTKATTAAESVISMAPATPELPQQQEEAKPEPELQVLFQSVPARQRMVAHLQQHCRLQTAHLRPQERNQALQCHDFSAQNANQTFACGGYLDITVRQYYYIKHGLKLRHPYMPCLMEFGGGMHASYYPLEVVHVLLDQQQRPHSPPQQACRRVRRAPLFGGLLTKDPSSVMPRTVAAAAAVDGGGAKQVVGGTDSAPQTSAASAPPIGMAAGQPSAAMEGHARCCCCCRCGGEGMTRRA